MEMPVDTAQFAIDLPGTNDWDNVELLRGAVQSCVSAMFGQDDDSETVAMIVGELLENAVKYGAWGENARWFRLRVWSDQGRVHVSVESPVRSPDGPDIRRVMETISWIDTFPSAEEAYAAKLIEVAARPRGQKLSQLGLVRIAYEGNCVLRADVHDRSLRVTATLPAAPRASASTA